MELLQLRYFLTVSKMLNISRAAKYHMIPQPAMSKTISKLEKELGMPLFDRYKNHLTLTEAGKSFSRSVSIALRELDNGAQNILQADSPLSGELKLLVRQHRSTVVNAMADFKKLYPKASFRVYYEQEDMEYADLDLCIAHKQPDEAFNGSVCLITEKLKILVPSNHPAAKQDKIRFTDLQGEEFATFSQNSSLWQQTQLHCQEAGFDPKISVSCGDIFCLMQYVAAGMAIALVPEISWQEMKSDKVVFIPTEPEVLRATYLYWNELKTPSRLCIAFRDFLTDYFHKLSLSKSEPGA